MPHPPEVAELILRGLLPLDMRETVSGDLLEEYRESRVPAVGEFRADLWYWRQVGGMWLRAYWWLVVSAVLLLVVSDVFNTFRAPSGASYLDGLPRLVGAVLSPLVARRPPRARHRVRKLAHASDGRADSSPRSEYLSSCGCSW